MNRFICTLAAIIACTCFAAPAQGSVACPGDISDSSQPGEDFEVNLFDLLLLIDGWNSDAPGAELAEPFDVVNLLDLLALLDRWGACTFVPGNVCTLDEVGTAHCQLPDGKGRGAGDTLAAISDRDAGFIVADEFRLEKQTELATICWYGIYRDSTTGAVCFEDAVDDFQLTIYAAMQGAPGSAVASQDIGALTLGVDKVYTGDVIGNPPSPVFQYTYTIPAGQEPLLQVNTCYWIEISNGVGDGCAWLWLTAPSASGLSMRRPTSDSDYDYDMHGQDYDLAWCINPELAGFGDKFGCDTNVCDPLVPFCGVLCQTNGYVQSPQDFTTAGVSDNDLNMAIGGTESHPIVRADEFIVDVNGDITTVCWWGVYREYDGNAFIVCNDEPTTDGEEEFIITYYDATGDDDLPGAVIGGPFTVNPSAAQRADSGLTFGTPASTVWEWSVSHDPVAVSQGQKVWVSIVGNTAGAANQCTFLWAEGSGAVDAPTGNGMSAIDGDAYVGFDLAWAVDIDGSSPGAPPAPANDSCSGAVVIATSFFDSSTALAINNFLATPLEDGADDPDLPIGSPSCHWDDESDEAHHTIWFTATVPATGVLRIEACTNETDDANTLNDSTIAIFTGSCGSLTEVACGEDNCTNAAPWYSCAEAAGLTPGETVYICIMNPGGWDGDQPGELLVNLHSTSGCP